MEIESRTGGSESYDEVLSAMYIDMHYEAHQIYKRQSKEFAFH